ncbi:gametocyte-specific factor 1-like [Venturia canescens]|uniref:gametocyte-specific factor 1-like n=1 Tax=Venturia canescens TaxID=32260 RepID=UPI001C9C5BAE|nr:gametocyte-specific factor 1-like [Venturia canescens]XP_043271301.1 gametocyte-specific factor 1-like [Venturia canescens]
MTDPNILERPIICPYDRNHRIAPSRIQIHLVKCSKNYPPDYKVSCPYNATHRLFRNEVEEHINNCRDHQHVNPGIYETCSKRGADMSSVASECFSVVGSQETWEDDNENSLYPVIYPPDCPSVTPMNSESRRNLDNRLRYIVPSRPLSLHSRNRAPSGLAQALMMEQSEQSEVEDMESVKSFMGVGRGKPWSQPHNEMITKIGRGRGSAQVNKND